MKRVALAAVALLSVLFSIAGPINASSNNGSWSNSANWSLNRAPQTSDTIVIAAGKTIVVDNVVSYGDVYLKVYGTLLISGRLEVGTNSTVIVYNGGKVQGSGNNGDKIRIGTAFVFKGDDPTVLGPVVATSTTFSFVAYSQAPLPVKFVGYTVARRNTDVLVQWATSEEVNAASYQVERSLDGSNWTVAGTVAAAGTSKVLNNYSFTDKQMTARQAYYRIRQVDIDGRFTYTAVKTVKADASNEIRVSGTQGKVVLQFDAEIRSALSVRIVNLSGQVLSEQKFAGAAGQVILSTSLKGNYVVSISNGSDLSLAKQVQL